MSDAVEVNSRGIVLPLALPVLAAPCLYRFAWAWSHKDSTSLTQAVRFVPQDLSVAWGVMMVFLLVAAMTDRMTGKEKLNRVTRLIACLLTAAVTTLIQLLFLLDFVVQFRTGVRVEWGFLRFFSWASTVSASIVSAIGIPILVALLIVSLGHLTAIGWLTFSRWRQRNRSWRIVVAGPVLLFLAHVAVLTVPAESQYDHSNIVYSLQGELRASWTTEPVERLDSETVKLLLTPENEDFTRFDDGYPLLKWTSGFHGEKAFDVQVDEGETPHVIFLILESFRAKDIGALGAQFNASPHFDQLCRSGVLFSNFYANGVQTSRCTVSTFFGVLPSFHFRSVQTDNPDLSMIGLNELLKPVGYHTAFLTGTPLDFENQGEFFRKQQFDTVLGEEWVRSVTQGEIEGSSWGVHDEHLMRAAADWIATQDAKGQSVVAAMLTVSNHDPWLLPSGHSAPDFPTAMNAEHQKSLRTFHYSDHCLGLFFDLLTEKGIAEDCIVFVMADTGCPRGEHDGNLLLVQHLYEENMHIPLLIVAPGRLDGPVRIDSPASQVDIMPTVLDLLSIQGWNHSVGNSLVRKNASRSVWLNNPFALGYLGLRRGSDKFIDAPRRGTTELYDLSSDPFEQSNQARTRPEDVSRYQQQTRAVHGVLRSLYATERLAPEELPPPLK